MRPQGTSNLANSAASSSATRIGTRQTWRRDTALPQSGRDQVPVVVGGVPLALAVSELNSENSSRITTLKNNNNIS